MRVDAIPNYSGSRPLRVSRVALLRYAVSALQSVSERHLNEVCLQNSHTSDNLVGWVHFLGGVLSLNFCVPRNGGRWDN